jgi:hypothetical protein
MTEAEKQTKITEAETAYHRIVTGGGVVEIVSPAGERLRFSEGSSSDLWKYIQWLYSVVASDSALTVGPRRAPIGFFF